MGYDPDRACDLANLEDVAYRTYSQVFAKIKERLGMAEHKETTVEILEGMLAGLSTKDIARVKWLVEEIANDFPEKTFAELSLHGVAIVLAEKQIRGRMTC